MVTKRPKTCDLCGKKVDDHEKLAKHLEKVHDQKLEFSIINIPSKGVSFKRYFLYKCEDCCKKFISLHLFEKHKTLEHSLYTCEKCPRKFASRNERNYHVRYHDPIFECNECGKVYKDRQSFIYHVKYRHSTVDLKPVQCDRCNKFFDNPYRLSVHKDRCMKEKICSPCYICGINILTSSLRPHLKLHKGIANVKCKICCKSVRPTSLKVHMETHKSDCKIKCDQCTSVLSSLASYRHHVKFYHREIVMRKCKLCPKEFRDNGHLKRHVNTVHNTDEEKAFCDICQKYMKNENSLKSHINIAHKNTITEHKCSFCAKVFKHDNTLRSHVKSKHSGVSGEQCPTCGEIVRFGGLKSHIRNRHSVRQTYTCDHCQKSFLKRSGITEHIKSHEKPIETYKCELCDVIYERKTCYLSHMEKHEEHPELFLNADDPQECDKCGKIVKNIKYLRQHMNDVHRYLSVCPVCGKKFVQEPSLTKHMKNIHKLDLPTIRELKSVYRNSLANNDSSKTRKRKMDALLKRESETSEDEPSRKTKRRSTACINDEPKTKSRKRKPYHSSNGKSKRRKMNSLVHDERTTSNEVLDDITNLNENESLMNSEAEMDEYASPNKDDKILEVNDDSLGISNHEVRHRRERSIDKIVTSFIQKKPIVKLTNLYLRTDRTYIVKNNHVIEKEPPKDADIPVITYEELSQEITFNHNNNINSFDNNVMVKIEDGDLDKIDIEKPKLEDIIDRLKYNAKLNAEN